MSTGDGTVVGHSSPQAVIGLHMPAVAVDSGGLADLANVAHTCALLNEGNVTCWYVLMLLL